MTIVVAMPVVAIQYLYGESVESETLSPDRTLPPSDMMGMDMIAMGMCEQLRFDAILQHMVNGEYRTFAFDAEFYMEITENGLAYVSEHVSLFLSRLKISNEVTRRFALESNV